MQGDRSTAPPKRKAKRVAAPRGKGPLAPKPSGVFAQPVKAPSVTPKPKQPVKPARTVSALDVLPARKGDGAKPYQPAPAKTVVAKVRKAKVKAQHEARDTKGNAERAQVDAYKSTAAYLQAVKDASAGRQKPATGLDLANRTTKVVPLDTRPDRPRSDTELQKFLATGVRPTRRGSRENLVEANQPLPVQLLRRTVKDYVDMHANFVPAMYELGKTAIHDPKKAGSMLAQPYVDLAKHPVKSFTEHPGNSTLLLLGVKGAAGRGAGKTLRSVPSDRAKKLGSTARETESPGNIRANTSQPYSKDSITKAGQVAAEKVQARRARKKGKPAPARTMSEKDIAKRVDADVAVGRTVAGHNEGQAAKAAEKALGKKPTAATSAVAQGLTDGSVADLQALIAHYRAKASTLDGEALDRNRATVALLEDALKKHDPAKVVAAAKAYSDVRAPGEAATVAGGFVKPAVAEATRLAGVAVRRHGVQTGAEAPKVARQAAKDARKAAAKDLRVAKRKAAGPDARVVTDAKVRLGQAQVRARGNAARRRVVIARAAQKDTGPALASREEYIAKRPASRDPEPELGKLTQNIKPGPPGVRIESEHVKAKFADGTDAGWGRELPGSKVVVERGPDGTPIGAMRFLVEGGHPTIIEVAVDPKFRGKGIASRLVQAAHAAGYDMRQALGHDQQALTEAGAALAHKNLAKAQAGARGIGKSLGATKAQRVTAYIKAVEDGDRPTMLRLARQEAADKATVKSAKAKVKTARVAQRTGPQAARQAAEAARRTHVDTKAGLKAGAYVGPNGNLIPLSVVRGSKGPVEPVYVSHNPGGDVRPAAVPTEPPTVAVKAARSGKALDEGTIDLHPDRLVKQAADSQRKLDAAKNYNRFLDDFSHRKTKGGSPEVYGNTGTAEAAASALRNSTGIDWVAARTFDGNYRLVPKAAATRLAQHAQHTDNFMGAFTRQWSKNVLAFSPRWLAGQAIEPGFRAAVAHAGPRSIQTTRRVLKGIEKTHGPDAVAQFKARTMSSGLQTAARRPLEHAGAQKEARGLSKALQSFAKKPGPRELGKLYNFTTNLTMGTLNHLVQNPSQYAMVGKAIRDSDLMSKHTVKLSQAAIDDFVRTGGKDVNVQARLGREVERMAGKYNGFSPRVQAAIAGYTPFLAWTLSATNFLFSVLPKDHPVLASVIAASNLATENWRKANGLQFDPFAKGQEGWLQGSIPGAGGSHLRLGRYVPFGLGNDDAPFLGPYADAILPQMSGVIAAVKGEDFTGTNLTGAHGLSPSLGREAAAAATSIGKGVVPLATQILTLAGVHTPDNADSRKVKPTVGARARGQFDPFMFTPGSGATAAPSGSSSGSGALPAGVSQRELDQLVRDARKAASQPQVSQAEIDALLKATR